MKVVIKKTTNGLYRITKETTLESIITDAMTILVIVVLVVGNIVISSRFGNSFILNLFTVLILSLWFIGGVSRARSKDMTKEDLIKELEEQIKDFSKESEVNNA